MTMDSDELYFPVEIIRNILKRLPVKSLIRFQCVCKLWKNLIKNPSFITDHLQQYSHRNPSLLFEYNHEPWRCCLRLLDGGLQIREVHIIDSLKDARIVGSCNGLLCVGIYQHKKSPSSLSLWNPLTRAVRHVPRSRNDDFLDECVTGFGFSPIVDDYMIVRTYAKFRDGVSRVEVFSLSRGSWEGIDIANVLERVRLNSENVTANGFIYWSGVKRGAEEEIEDNREVIECGDYVDVIVSFDIANQVFTLIEMPDLDINGDAVLAVHENKLAILSEIWTIIAPDLVELWLLDEGASGKTWRWIKRFSTCPIGSTIMWGNDIVCEPLLSIWDIEQVGRNILYLMNLTTNKSKSFVIPYCGPINGIYNYVESLVSVGDNYIEES